MNNIVNKLDELIELLVDSIEYTNLQNQKLKLERNSDICNKIFLYEFLKKDIQKNESNIISRTQLLNKLDAQYSEYLLMPDVIQYLHAKAEFNKLEYSIYSYIKTCLKKELN